MVSFRALACAALAMIAGVSAAFSHVTLTQRSAPADSYYRATFTVPHGCEGAATTRISIWLPEAILQVKPQVKPGWKTEILRRGWTEIPASNQTTRDLENPAAVLTVTPKP
jgi:uncharacterized protein YcnI